MKRSREQIDSLERLLQAGMPGKCVIENAFLGLRTAISEELDEQWRRGVSHGQLTYSPQEMITGPFSPLREPLLPEKTFETELRQYLDEEPMIDLDELQREVNALTEDDNGAGPSE